ncbi:hypothetical protein GCM10020218_007310 [Dactylosporangium vinaceum]
MIISQPIPITTTAGWGIGLAVTCAVIAVVFSIFTCGLSLFLLLGLLFLTARTTAMSGPLVVSIQSGPYHYMAQELVYSPLHAAQAHPAARRSGRRDTRYACRPSSCR